PAESKTGLQQPKSYFRLVSDAKDAAADSSEPAASPAAAADIAVDQSTKSENPGKSVPTTIESKTADSPTTQARSGSAESTSGSPIVVVPGASGMLVLSDDKEALKKFQDLFNILTSKGIGPQHDYTVFYLKHARADRAVAFLNPFFPGGVSPGSSTGGAVSDMSDAIMERMGGGLGALMSMASAGGGNNQPQIHGASGAKGSGGLVSYVSDPRLNALFVEASP